MQIELIGIGNEVLRGFTINSNGAFMAQELLREGFCPSRHTVLPDDPKQLKRGLDEALLRADVVITTGGLGPTRDDITRTAAAELFGSDFYHDETIAKDIIRRYGGDHPSIEDQATVPTKATPLLNTVGTAPGLIFTDSRGTLILLPGVPAEMEALFLDQVIPYLKKHYSPERLSVKEIHLFGLPEVAIEPTLREINDAYPDVEMGIYPSYGVVTVRLVCKDATRLEKPYQRLCQEFASHRFTSKTLEEAIHTLFIEKGITLSVAESCTGGSVAARLTQLSGASNYFLGSVVAYANDVKVQVLGVSQKTLNEHGAVSEEVVSQMALGSLDITKSDYALAVSGIAGPTGAPVGKVWCAVAKKGEKPHAWEILARGNRSVIITRSVNALLGELYRIVNA